MGPSGWIRVGKWTAFACAPLLAINLAVATFGNTVVFPLSPFRLADKTAALGRYFAHRPRCLGRGHGDLQPLIRAAERRHRLPRGLLAAIVQIESGGRPHRISWAGAMGPAQIMPATARQLGLGDPFDPETALDASARYLSWQLARYRNVRLAVAAYNAGPGAVAVAGKVPQNGETEHYVRKVLHLFRSRHPLAGRT